MDRILSIATSPNLVAEVVRDFIEQPSSTPHALFTLGRQIATTRLISKRAAEEFSVLQHVVLDANNARGALALAGGIALALKEHRRGEFVKWQRICKQLAAATKESVLGYKDRGGMLQVWAELIGTISAPNVSMLIDEAAASGNESGARVLEVLAQTSYADARRVANTIHAMAVSVLNGAEQRHTSAEEKGTGVVLRIAEALAQRFLVDDAYVGVGLSELWSLWVLVADSLACVHSGTLETGGRAGPLRFRNTSSLLIGFAMRQSSSALLDASVRQLFAVQQPCLRFLGASSSLGQQAVVGYARECTVLFYLDLLEHLVSRLQPHLVKSLVIPLAARYAEALNNMPEWYESAHALILAIMESATAMNKEMCLVTMELVPWYTQLLLDQFPSDGISAELLQIAFTAAVQSLTNGHSSRLATALAWDCVERLLKRVDDFRATGAVQNARRRELLGVVAEQLASLPPELLPALMREIDTRVDSDTDWALMKYAADTVQQIVLDKADLSRKPALSAWAWQLRARVNQHINSKL
ncbi:hypothetical protein IWW36_002328 [Coemansia brasiliensis]|uniref:Uncharacterized protein n=1 Tax=Coemansia brasiliensis TaxID=2650707 RepID=A0A9W8I7G2_9FUNG|nr:hypothetical protein IWW36_002328 [Coemansia brasiliensis]